MDAEHQILDAVRDPARLHALRRVGLLDSPAEPAFDRLTRLASRLVRAPVALVSLVDFDRQFFKSQIGLPTPWSERRETPLTHSFCKHVVTTGEPLIVDDARAHALVCDNGAVADLGVAAYAGIPLTLSDGHVLGALCAIDTQPREWTADQLALLEDLAAAVTTEIELRSELVTRRETEDSLRQAKANAEAANEAKSAFLTNMSHELRTPLNSIIGFANVLRKRAEGLNDDDRAYLERIRDNGTHLLKLINKVLDLAKIEAGRVELEISDVDPRSLVDSVVSQFEGQRSNTGVRLETDLPASCSPVQADELRLTQVLINLVGNAVKFTERGRILVSLTSHPDGRPRALSVVDSGIGIPADRLEAIFNAFEQADNTTERRFGGTGLGLAISVGLLRRMGFDLTVASEPGHGSTFTIDFLPRG